MLTIIIPVLNEEKILKEKKTYFQNLTKKIDVIFVDGGSSDKTLEIANTYGTVISSPLGRGIQKNTGAVYAHSENLLFLNVDTSITNATIEQIIEAFNQGINVGCLTMRIEHPAQLFKVFTKIINFRAKHLNIIDADLGMFINKKTFNIVGQFEHLPYMEDIVFSKKLRKYIKPIMLTNAINVSSRKWEIQGIIQTFFCYLWAYVQLSMGLLKSNLED